jgi:putative Mn2+ efflux pump MntP
LAGLRLGLAFGAALGRPFALIGGLILIGIGLQNVLSHLPTA